MQEFSSSNMNLATENIIYVPRGCSPTRSPDLRDINLRLIQVENQLSVVPQIQQDIRASEQLLYKLTNDNDVMRKIQQRLLDDMYQLKHSRKSSTQSHDYNSLDIQLIFEQTTRHLIEEVERRLKNMKDDIWGLIKFKKSIQKDTKSENELQASTNGSQEKASCFNHGSKLNDLFEMNPSSSIEKSSVTQPIQTEKQPKQTSYIKTSGIQKIQEYLQQFKSNQKGISQKTLNSYNRMYLMNNTGRLSQKSQSPNDLLTKFSTSQYKFLLKSPRHQKTNSFENLSELLRVNMGSPVHIKEENRQPYMDRGKKSDSSEEGSFDAVEQLIPQMKTKGTLITEFVRQKPLFTSKMNDKRLSQMS